MSEEHDRQKIINKLIKIKALAEKGSGGESAAAAKLYEKLVEMYKVSLEELDSKAFELIRHSWGYKNSVEKRLLMQIIYKVIGGGNYYSDSRHLEIDCTELEAAEISMLFNLYRKALQKEFDSLMTAFMNKNDIFPDETARLYKKHDSNESSISREELEKIRKMMAGLDKIVTPRAAITYQEGV